MNYFMSLMKRMNNGDTTIPVWALFLSAFLAVSSFTPVAYSQDSPNPWTVQINAPVHFLSPDGNDIVITENTYEVEQAEHWIRLVPRNGASSTAFLLEAKTNAHEEDLETPLAMSFPGEDDDLLHLALLLPNGRSLETVGTYSGIRPRGIWKKIQKTRKRISTVVKLRRPTNQSTHTPAPRIRDHRRSKNQPSPVCLSNVQASFNKIPTKVRKRQIIYSTKKYLGARNTLLPKPAYMSWKQVENLKAPTEHFQGIQRLHGKARGQYFVVSGGLKFGTPHRSQLIVYQMGSQSPTGPWALPSYGHNYKTPHKKDRTVKVVNIDDRLWHAGGIQVLDFIVGIPIWGDRGDSEIRFYDLRNPRNPQPLSNMTIKRKHTKANAIALTKLQNGYFMAMVYDDKTLDFYRSKTNNVFDGFKPNEKDIQRVHPKHVKGEWESGGGLPLAGKSGKGAYQNINFLTQCNGTIYMVGMRNKSKIAPVTVAADYATLYQVHWANMDYTRKPTIKKIKRRQFYCYNQQCNFGAGAGMFALNRHRLFLYGASHWLHDENKRFNFNEYSY